LAAVVVTQAEARPTETRTQTRADLVVSASTVAAGFDAATVECLREVRGAEVSVTSATAVYVLEEGVVLLRSDARTTVAGPLDATVHLRVSAGRGAAFGDDAVTLNEEWARQGAVGAGQLRHGQRDYPHGIPGGPR
jgi:putative ABC transport system permease protein